MTLRRAREESRRTWYMKDKAAATYRPPRSVGDRLGSAENAQLADGWHWRCSNELAGNKGC